MLTWLANLLYSDENISADLPTIVAAGDVRYATARLQRLKRKLVALGAQFPARPLVFSRPQTRAAFDGTEHRRMLIDEAHVLLCVAEQIFEAVLFLPGLQAIHALLDQAGHKLQVATDIGTWTCVPFDAGDCAAANHFQNWEYACGADVYYGADGSADGGSDGGDGNGGDGGGDGGGGDGGGGDGGGGGD
jgi:uncharacterized membrane protein YgcG